MKTNEKIIEKLLSALKVDNLNELVSYSTSDSIGIYIKKDVRITSTSLSRYRLYGNSWDVCPTAIIIEINEDGKYWSEASKKMLPYYNELSQIAEEIENVRTFLNI